jgi:hypothetical protein
LFYDRVQGNDVYGLSGLAPTSYKESVSNLTFAQIQALNTGVPPSIDSLSLTPNSPGQSYPYPNHIPWDAVQNASLDLQQEYGGRYRICVGSFLQPANYIRRQLASDRNGLAVYGIQCESDYHGQLERRHWQ